MAAVLVSGLDASDGCSEIHALFETTGAITQILTVAPAADGRPAAALVCFADAASADAAVDLFDSYPWAGSFLEVQRTDAGATGRLLAALAEIQGAGPAPPTALTAPAAALAVAFATGAPVSLPAPFAGGAPSAAPTEPPAFGLENPEDWLPPANWQPPSAPAEPNATAWAAKTGGPAAVKQAPAPAQTQPGLPEWETDRRCRIYIQNLRQGVTAEDLKAYFTKFGKLEDQSVVPAKRIGFLVFRRAVDGAACVEAVDGTSVPGLSPSGSEPLHLEFRDLQKMQRHLATTANRPDVCASPTTRVFIGYFPRRTRASDVEAELARYGETTDVMLGGGADGGELYCFVSFRYVRDAVSAFNAIHGRTMPTLCGNRTMVCAYKQARR